MFGKIIISLLICAFITSVFAATGTDCGSLKTMELLTGVDGKQYIVFSTSTPPPYFAGTYTQVGQLGGGSTIYELPNDPTMAGLVYSSFERALHNVNIHFFYIAASWGAPGAKIPVDPSCPAGSPAIVTRYFFKNMQ